jgi:hypothetical protein
MAVKQTLNNNSKLSLSQSAMILGIVFYVVALIISLFTQKFEGSIYGLFLLHIQNPILLLSVVLPFVLYFLTKRISKENIKSNINLEERISVLNHKINDNASFAIIAKSCIKAFRISSLI